MADMSHAEHVISATADAVVDEVVAAVKAHPEYRQIVEALAAKALTALAAGL